MQKKLDDERGEERKEGGCVSRGVVNIYVGGVGGRARRRFEISECERARTHELNGVVRLTEKTCQYIVSRQIER